MITKRTVGFFDVLGFKALIKKTPLNEISKKYENLTDATAAFNRAHDYKVDVPRLFSDHPIGKQWCYRYLFSDSIILISNDASGHSCLKLLVYGWRLMQFFLSAKIPLRGGISFGEIFLNLEKNIILGKTLIDAYDLQEKQDWIGASIEKSVEKAYPNLFKIIKNPKNVLNPLFFLYDVPFKTGETQKMHTLNWRLNLVVEKGIRSLFSKSEDITIKKKVLNSLNYAKTVRDSNQVNDYRDDLPVELRAFLVGRAGALFDHGDDL